MANGTTSYDQDPSRCKAYILTSSKRYGHESPRAAPLLREVAHMPHLSPPTLTESEQKAILRTTAGNIRDHLPL